jgi:hypothetical protein
VIGWQGINLRVYDEWSVVGFGGDGKSGSMRIDSGMGDESKGASGLELRWSSSKGTQTTESLEARIKPLLQTVKRESKKSGAEAEVVTAPIADTGKGRDVSVAFRWSGSRAGSGRIWHCTKCARVVVAQVYGVPSSSFNRESKAILESIACHSSDAEWRTWGLYGLLVDVPADFTLIGQQLMNVYLQLKFQRGGSLDQLMVEQWSLANVQLKNSYLDEWYDLKSIGKTEGVRSEREEAAVNGHPALRVIGRRTDPAYLLLDVPRQYARFKRPALEYSAVLWECPESNRAYLIQTFTREPELPLAMECAARTACHALDSGVSQKSQSDVST